MNSISNITFHSFMKKCAAKENVPLGLFSTLKVGGPARYLVIPNNITQIKEIQLACIEYGIDLHVLSGGSNTLFSDTGFNGVVMKLGPAFDFININNKLIKVGAATSFAKLTKLAMSYGLNCAVGFSGIPGLVGGAIRMNAGTSLGEIKDIISLVHGIINGQEIIYEKKDIEFGYRYTNFPKNLIICQAELSYKHFILEPLDQVLAKAQEYRIKRKLTQPTSNSLGSFFKNPYPSFAAQLIEKCNLKGLKYNNAQISPMHANFIVNNGGASANDIFHIASIARQTVFDKFGIMLQPEVCLVGNFD